MHADALEPEMAEYEDLSAYRDGYSPFEMINVGWLGVSRGIPVSGAPLVDRLVERLAQEVKMPRSVTLGSHDCEFCTEEDGQGGNGEIHIYSTSHSVVFCAPLLILHYVRHHGYTPPASFLEALDSIDDSLQWDSRAETLMAILADPMGHAGWRANALYDLPRWYGDERAYRAVVASVDDEQIREIDEYELGMSLSRFWIKAGTIDAAVYRRLSPATQSIIKQSVF